MRKKSKRQLKADQEHTAFLRSFGYVKGMKIDRPNYFPEKYEDTNPHRLSNSIPGNGYKRTVDDFRWRRTRSESDATAREIERKKKQVAPGFNKGPTMFITEGMDPASLGRKV